MGHEPPDQPVKFELVLRYPEASAGRIADEAARLLAGWARAASDSAAPRSADPADLEAVRQFARHAGFTITAIDERTRRVQLEGTAAAIRKAFGVTLKSIGPPGQTHRDFDGALTLPRELEAIVVAVLNLSTKPVAIH